MRKRTLSSFKLQRLQSCLSFQATCWPKQQPTFFYDNFSLVQTFNRYCVYTVWRPLHTVKHNSRLHKPNMNFTSCKRYHGTHPVGEQAVRHNWLGSFLEPAINFDRSHTFSLSPLVALLNPRHYVMKLECFHLTFISLPYSKLDKSFGVQVA